MATTDGAYATSADSAAKTRLIERYQGVRAQSLARAAPLSAEDAQAQSMPDASPAKWHLAHVTWFFETFLLAPNLAGYQVFDPDFGFLFNSYYEAVGPRHPRPARGLVTRPTLAEVLAYRRHVDAGIERLLADAQSADVADLVILGLAQFRVDVNAVIAGLAGVVCNEQADVLADLRGGQADSLVLAHQLEHPGG